MQAKYPPLPDEENRIPDAMDPVTHEATTRHNFPDVAPTKFTDSNTQSNEVSIMGQKQDERQPSFFSQPGILAGEITVPCNFCDILILFVLHFVLAMKINVFFIFYNFLWGVKERFLIGGALDTQGSIVFLLGFHSPIIKIYFLKSVLGSSTNHSLFMKSMEYFPSLDQVSVIKACL